MSIERLNQGDATTAAQIPFYDPANGVDRRTPLSQIAEVLSGLTAAGGFITQYAAPNATGFSVAIAPPTDGASMLLLLTPAAGYAAGTITLPAQAACVDGQEVLVTSTQTVTTLTTAGNGATVYGAPAGLTAVVPFFRMRFDGVAKNWYRVG